MRTTRINRGTVQFYGINYPTGVNEKTPGRLPLDEFILRGYIAEASISKEEVKKGL